MDTDDYAPEPHHTPVVLVDFLPEAGQFLTANSQGQVTIRTYPSGNLINKYSLRPGEYRAFAVSPDGRLLAGGADASRKEVAAGAMGTDAGGARQKPAALGPRHRQGNLGDRTRSNHRENPL